jgi:hypothetical protein
MDYPKRNIRRWLSDGFNERDTRLIFNCIDYADGDPAGLPGHNLMLIVAAMAGMLDDLADAGHLPEMYEKRE